MANQHLLLIVFIASILQAATSDTAYDLLEKNNFPRALLPQGVKSYVNHGGAVEVTLPASCDFNVTVAGGSHKIRFDSIVSGVIRPGSITQLGGVRIQFEWDFLAFHTVQRVGDKLRFTGSEHAATFDQSFPVSNFVQSPTCS
ncbi:hypothetical protein CFC21_050897 [Triticum aestivum]|uniref:Uncharacterized protein n=3 Tax=Triticum TaxID=4564 RepID=A0A9R0VTJ3_TRITD|nr:hypothetical protein CFC21_050897 [Triticum aestivum]VAH87092.1 unnamed protein product [Triticum turgidum subsp. durum]